MAIGAEIGSLRIRPVLRAVSKHLAHMRSTSRASTALIQALVLSGQEVCERQYSQSMRTRTTRSRLFQGSHMSGKIKRAGDGDAGTADRGCHMGRPAVVADEQPARLSSAANCVTDVLPVMSRQRVT